MRRPEAPSRSSPKLPSDHPSTGNAGHGRSLPRAPDADLLALITACDDIALAAEDLRATPAGDRRREEAGLRSLQSLYALRGRLIERIDARLRKQGA